LANDVNPMSTVEELITESILHEESGDLHGALERATRAVEIARVDGSSNLVARALVRLSEALFLLGSKTRAASLCEEAIALAPDTPEAACAWITKAASISESQNLEAGEALFHQAVELCRRLRYNAGRARALSGLAFSVYVPRGQFDLALSSMEESARLKDRLGTPTWELPFLQAYVHGLAGDRFRARRALDELLPMVHPGSRVAGAYFYLWARLSLDEEELEKADEYLHLAFNIANTTGAPDLNIWVRLETSRYHLLKGEAPSAVNWADDAYRYARRTGFRFLAGQALLARGKATWETGDVNGAEQDLRAGIAELEKLGAAYELARGKFLLAALYHTLQRPQAEDLWLEAAGRITRGGFAFILEQERGLAFPLVEKYLHSRRREVREISDNLLSYLANIRPLPLRVSGLGYFRVWQGRKPIPDQAWSRRKAGELFRFLLLQPHRSAHRDAILDALWPDYPPSTAQDLFHQATSALRHILEPNLPVKFPSRYLRVESERVTLELPPGSAVDFEQFETLLPAAIEGKKIDELKRLLALYTGDLFPHDVYSDWSVGARERLAHLYVRGQLALAEGYLANGQVYPALECCMDVLKRDPWNEDAVLWGMKACLALNDAPRAMRLYVNLERTLQKELGITPRSDLRELVQQIRRR
jgi:DNA-binding SARP family transcriptional activator/tetratricopeptide (TPR) repeat protein